MQINNKFLHRVLSDVISYEILRFVDPCIRDSKGSLICYNRFGLYSYEHYINMDENPESILSRKFQTIVREFIKDNNLVLTNSEDCVYYNRTVDWYVKIFDVNYVITETQADEYHSIFQKSNTVKAAKYLSQILSIPLSTAYEFAKKNRYLKLI